MPNVYVDFTQADFEDLNIAASDADVEYAAALRKYRSNTAVAARDKAHAMLKGFCSQFRVFRNRDDGAWDEVSNMRFESGRLHWDFIDPDECSVLMHCSVPSACISMTDTEIRKHDVALEGQYKDLVTERNNIEFNIRRTKKAMELISNLVSSGEGADAHLQHLLKTEEERCLDLDLQIAAIKQKVGSEVWYLREDVDA